MPRRSEGIRLWLEPEERSPNGKLVRRASWVIRDGARKIRTGCAREDRASADRVLADYIQKKYTVSRERGRHPTEILILDILNIYLKDKGGLHDERDLQDKVRTARRKEFKQRIMSLADFWGERFLSDVNGQTCREFVAARSGKPWRSAKPERTGNPPRLTTQAAARRELEDLRAAINYHRREGLCSEIVGVWLPEKGEAREGWLTRSQAARILWAAWRARQRFADEKTEREVGKHIARFVLVALYTGTRSGAVCSAAFVPALGRGHIDLDQGIFHRHRRGARKTKKRQTAVRLAPRLLAHLRRWHRLGIARHAVVEWNGKPVRSIRKGFAAAVKASGITTDYPVTPHLLRHTAATWLMQRGTDRWQAAGFLGMSEEVLERVYGHHHPDFQAQAAKNVTGQQRDRNPVNKPAQG